MPEDIIHSSISRNPFAVFAPQPQGVSFDLQEDGEKIILLLRAHLITLVPALFLTIVLFLVPLFLPAVFAFLRVDILSVLNSLQIFLLSVFWYLLVFLYAFYKFIFWFFNVYIITNERILDFDFKGILHKETSFAKLNQIQDVSPKTIGFFGTFFNYGNINVQTAAERPEFEFLSVARPELVAQEILEQVRKEEGEPPGKIE